MAGRRGIECVCEERSTSGIGEENDRKWKA
jgi:hypothetical protein